MLNTFTKNWQGWRGSEESWNKFETEVEVSLLSSMLSKISMQTAQQETASSRTSKEAKNSKPEIATPLISDEDKTKNSSPSSG